MHATDPDPHTDTRAPFRSRRTLATASVAILIAVSGGCGDEETADVADVGAAEPSATDALASTPTEPNAERSPDTSVATGTADDEVDNGPALVDAVVVDTIELPRGDLGFLVSDGEALWATGSDGAIVRIDPDSGDVEELAIGDGLISGQLLPAVTDDGIWFSAIQGSHIVRLDPTTLTADPPIEVPGVVGLVHVGPGGQLWMELTGPPAGLLPVDPESGTTGDVVPIDTEGEMVGAAVAFGSMWAPLYEDRTILRMDETLAVIDRVPSGVGPSYVREAHGMLWHPNWIDGTISRIDPDAADVVGRRTLPGGRRIDQVGGMATFDDRLFVLDRPGRVLLELDTDQFANDDPAQVTETEETASPEELAIREAIRTLLSTATTATEMQLSIADGERLIDPVNAFKQFFEDNLPGELYEGELLSVRLDGDRADVEFFVTVAGAPVGDPIQGTMVREDGRWLLTAASFCRLVATGEIDCPDGVAPD